MRFSPASALGLPAASRATIIALTKKLRPAALAITIVLSAVTSSHAAAIDKQICNVSADVALGVEDYPAAIRLHRHVLRLHPNDALAHYHLGFAYGMTGRRLLEIAEYRTAASLGLEKWDLFLNLGLAYLEDDELEQAGTALEHAVALGPDHAESHLDLALIYEREHRLEGALQEITASRRLEPSNPDAWNTNAIICAEMGDFTCARTIWTQLTQGMPDYRMARTNLEVLNRSRAGGYSLAALSSTNNDDQTSPAKNPAHRAASKR